MHPTGQLSPEEFWARVDHGDDQLRAGFEPVGAYGLTKWGGTAMLAEWDVAGTTRVIAYARPAPPPERPDLPAEARTPPHHEPDAATAEPDVQVHWREGSSREVVEQLRGFWRARRARGGAAYRPVRRGDELPSRLLDLNVDGQREPFEVWVQGPTWWAATTIGGRALVVEAHDVTTDLIALTRIRDIEPLLEGRRAFLRRNRPAV